MTGHLQRGWQTAFHAPEVREERVLVVAHVVGKGVEGDPCRVIETYYVKRGEGWEPLCERDRTEEFSATFAAARAARLAEQALQSKWLSSDPDGANYKPGAPLDEIARLDALANEAAGKAHSLLDAIIRGRR